MSDPADLGVTSMREVLMKAWRGWLRVARVIGHVQTRILMTVFYFVVMALFAIAVRLFTDPLGLKRSGSWRALAGAPAIPTVEAARQQF
jgi:hypothetical protein